MSSSTPGHTSSSLSHSPSAAQHARRLNRSSINNYDSSHNLSFDGASQPFVNLLSEPRFAGGMAETVVETLARGVYGELEKIISKCGDEKIVEDLMPVVVNILEVLGHTHTRKSHAPFLVTYSRRIFSLIKALSRRIY